MPEKHGNSEALSSTVQGRKQAASTVRLQQRQDPAAEMPLNCQKEYETKRSDYSALSSSGQQWH